MKPRLVVPLILAAAIAAAVVSQARAPLAWAGSSAPEVGPIAWQIRPDTLPPTPLPRDSMRRDSIPRDTTMRDSMPRDTMRRDTVARDTTHKPLPKRVPKQSHKPKSHATHTG